MNILLIICNKYTKNLISCKFNAQKTNGITTLIYVRRKQGTNYVVTTRYNCTENLERFEFEEILHLKEGLTVNNSKIIIISPTYISNTHMDIQLQFKNKVMCQVAITGL